MKFTKSYWQKYRRNKARARRRAAEREACPYKVIVSDMEQSPALSLVEVRRFNSYERAKAYADIYNNDGTSLTAYIEYAGEY